MVNIANEGSMHTKIYMENQKYSSRFWHKQLLSSKSVIQYVEYIQNIIVIISYFLFMCSHNKLRHFQLYQITDNSDIHQEEYMTEMVEISPQLH